MAMRCVGYADRRSFPSKLMFCEYTQDDGYDETIYPLDHKQAGMIIDDAMHEVMVRPLPAGCRLTAIYDCQFALQIVGYLCGKRPRRLTILLPIYLACHSGSALDLPYMVRVR